MRWSGPIARFYGRAFEVLGLKWFQRAYGSRVGVAWVRVSAVALVLISVYWVVVGTG